MSSFCERDTELTKVPSLHTKYYSTLYLYLYVKADGEETQDKRRRRSPSSISLRGFSPRDYASPTLSLPIVQ